MVRLLIVDDEAELVKNIAGYLASYPGEFKVLTAYSAEEAEELLAREEVDILLTDVRLPGRDGIELVRRAFSLRPGLRVVVMTAFPSPEIQKAAVEAGALRYAEKPLDLEELREILLAAAMEEMGWSGSVGGLEIFDIAQLLALSGKSKTILVACGQDQGVLVFESGQLVHASMGSLEGCEAFFAMAVWPAGSFEEVKGNRGRKFPRNVPMSTTNLMLEAARRRDEARARGGHGVVFPLAEPVSGDLQEARADLWPDNATPQLGVKRKEARAMAIREHLSQLQGIEGFIGAAVFLPTGEMLDAVTSGNIDIKLVGTFANNALLNAQKATDQMGVGRGNMIQIRAPQATVIMRCLNEATDFAVTAAGKAHFHTVVVMNSEGNIGMGVMVLDKIVGKIAEEFH